MTKNNPPHNQFGLLKTVKDTYQRFISNPLSKVRKTISAATRPYRSRTWEVLKPYFQPFIHATQPIRDIWASFAKAYPRTAVWTRRSLKLFGIIFSIYLLFIYDIFGKVPTTDELRDLQTENGSELYTADGTFLGTFFKENRKDVKFEDLPKNLIDALVATEDERFWEHSGVDLRSLGRVFFKTFLGGDESSGGGSTISMQLAKNLYPRPKLMFFSTPIAKIRETIIASRIEKVYSKQQIITFYLNTVPFSNNSYGVRVAARRIFNKEPRELLVEESAVLVGMLKANTTYNPLRNPQNAKERRNIVLYQMVKNNSLKDTAYQRLKNIPLTTNANFSSDKGGVGAYFREYLRQELPTLLQSPNFPKKPDGKPYDIYKDGLKIYTSLDGRLQKHAEDAAEEHMKVLQQRFDDHWRWGDERLWSDYRVKIIEDGIRNSRRYKILKEAGWNDAKIKKNFETPINITLFSWKSEDGEEKMMTPIDSVKRVNEILNVGFMALDPITGQIKAWVGGNDFNFFQYDHVKARRQVGSTFKPIVYAQALRAGLRPCDSFPNELMSYPEDGSMPKMATFNEEKDKLVGWTPRNADGNYGGFYSMEGGLRMSVNAVTAHLTYRVGAEAVRQMAAQLGITADIPKNDISIGLGTTDISLFDMLKVYGTFANRGLRPEVTGVLKIVTREGKVIYDYQKSFDRSKWQQVLTTDQADMLNKMLQTVVEEGTASRLSAYGIENNFAGKTGTTQSHADGWFIGYNSNLVVGAWVGAESNGVRFRTMSEGQGAATALPICGKFLQRVWADPQYAALKNIKFEKLSLALQSYMDCPRSWGVKSDDSDGESGGEEEDSPKLPNDIEFGDDSISAPNRK